MKKPPPVVRLTLLLVTVGLLTLVVCTFRHVERTVDDQPRAAEQAQ